MAFEASQAKPTQSIHSSTEKGVTLNQQARAAAFRCLYWLMKNEIPHTTNYKSILDLCKEQVLNNLHKGDNDKGESQRFIQEAVLTMGNLVQRPLLNDLRASPWYSIMVDETTDVAVVKDLIVYARSLKDGKSCTEFMTVLHLSSGTADAILESLTNFLREIDLPLEKMCAIGSDGAAVMVGRQNGVSTQLRRQVPHLLSNHCVAHRLALAVGQASKGVPYLQKFKDILGQLHRFYANSAVRMDGLRQIQDLQNDPVLKLSQAKDVRWLSHDKATQTLKLCLPSVIASLEREAKERNDSQAMGLAVFVQTYKFLLTLSMMCDILPHMSALSKAMQAKDAIFTTVKPLVHSTLSLLRQLREEPVENMKKAPALITSL
ncbi:zinc finger protein 862-like [Mercenaria mercenaria]|uniref:zinc finger protein 862-like n=1 Tax=Mercenaria mercenaria TaxID=6596 RepID=UPI00234E56D4|nr:zinc finger protein 862-like [Mercenaria mercenaria]XP_053409203.1 zinc finger protein 862-like [Mercenaria mercenaria]XP_053409204.1 zinc finger protein 862-like [Mercenaria mercenaria]XP_053409205.1 zinc finger protein 862-like [Mercenaria mercenaria]XP_053409207.1 zinc finger protein 862-like [Mercenaria mercenaria]XP_053409208.1 zinc finger protein 862-like [Mercenaria mercenaria]